MLMQRGQIGLRGEGTEGCCPGKETTSPFVQHVNLPAGRPDGLPQRRWYRHSALAGEGYRMYPAVILPDPAPDGASIAPDAEGAREDMQDCSRHAVGLRIPGAAGRRRRQPATDGEQEPLKLRAGEQAGVVAHRV